MSDPFLFQEKVVLLKPDTTYGQDSVPTGAANAILALNGTFDPNPQTPAERNLMRPYLGNAKRPIGGRHVSLQMDIEIAGSGITPPSSPAAYGPALRAAGLAETAIATVGQERVEYDPITGGYESATIYFHHDAALHQMLGVRGELQVVFAAGQIPVYRLSYLGLHVAPTATAIPDVDFSGFREPEVADNVTFSLHGFAATVQSLQLNLGNNVVYRELMNGKSVNITGRAPSGTVVVEAPPLAQKDYFAAAEAETLGALQLIHGTAAGDIVQVDAPAVQLINPRYSDVDGVTHIEMDLNPTPTSAGNDEIKITTK